MKILRVTCCLFVLLLSLVSLAFVAVPPTAAQELNPPPPFPGAICRTTGQDIICQGSFSDSGVNRDTGLSCGSFQILASDNLTIRFTIFYNQAGNATKGILHVRDEGTLSNAVTGQSVPWSEAANETITFGTPGNTSTVTATLTGAFTRVTLPGGGLIVGSVGKIVMAPDGSIIFETPPYRAFDQQLQELCAVLS